MLQDSARGPGRRRGPRAQSFTQRSPRGERHRTQMSTSRPGINWLNTFVLLLAVPAQAAQETPASPPPLPVGLQITRAAGPIVVDGLLEDEGWKGAPRVETWFETNPGD